MDQTVLGVAAMKRMRFWLAVTLAGTAFVAAAQTGVEGNAVAPGAPTPPAPSSKAAKPAKPAVAKSAVAKPAATTPAVVPAAKPAGKPGAAKGAPKPRTDGARYLDRLDVAAWIADVADRDSMPVDQIRRVLADAVAVPDAIRLNAPAPPPDGTPPPAPPSWKLYKRRNVDQRLDAGLQFWTDNAQWLSRAEERFGVPAEFIVAIAGIETQYGRIQGNFKVVDTLLTLGFDWPATAKRDRSAFFKGQLEELLLLTRFRPDDATTMLGSYAGAVGIGQFMPGSLRKYAIDFDGDSEIDVRNSSADAIGSIANFLAEHGWKRGAPVWHDAALDPGAEKTIDPFVGHDLVARHSVAQLAAAGARCSDTLDDERLALIDLATPDEAVLYRCAAPNFFVVTQYNRSFFYAAAVTELAQALRARIATTPPSGLPVVPREAPGS